MKKALLGISAIVALASLPAASYAQFAFNVGAVSDYRYRGISQSRLKPALQGGADFTAGGLYLGAWASTIKWIKDAGGDAGVELDLYGGYKGAISEGLAYDVGVLTYQYPGHDLAVSPVTTEIYGALSFGPATLKYSHSVSNLFGFADSKNSGYLDLSATFDVDGILLTPHVGYQKVSGSSDYSYTDVSFGVSKDFSGLVVSATAVYADTKKIGGAHTYAGPSGKNHAKAGVVLGVKYNF
ncbi:MAG: TorF family putative porin [Rubrivivax sp.]|nr:TorF family putative porin [Rubrivivax sp.]